MEKTFYQRLVYDFWYFALLIWARIYLRVRFYNRRNVPHTGAVIVISNHQSFLDPPLIGTSQWRQMYYMARKTLFKGFFGRLLRTVGAYPVSQDGNAIAGIKETLKLLKKEQAVLMFPEGSRTEDGRMHTFLGGIVAVAKRAKVPIVPCAVNGAYRAFPRGAKIPRPYKVTVTFGELIPVEEIQKHSDEELLRLLTEKVAEMLWEDAKPEAESAS